MMLVLRISKYRFSLAEICTPTIIYGTILTCNTVSRVLEFPETRKAGGIYVR